MQPRRLDSLFMLALSAGLVTACGTEQLRVISDSGTPLPQAGCLDTDGDGFAGTGDCAALGSERDCDDSNPAVRPGAPELCNGSDDNCNQAADEGLTFADYFADADGDGAGSTTAVAQSSCQPVAGSVTNATDCDDTRATVNPGAPEVCNGVDDNCDGQRDEGVTQLFYPDADGDGFGAASSVGVADCAAGASQVANHTDCNDGDAAVRPTASERCNGVDDDCNGTTDDGNPGGGGTCTTGQAGICAAGTLSCTSGTLSCVRTIAPSAERCNGIDDDCNGSTDEGNPSGGAACSTGQAGVCAAGTSLCSGGAISCVRTTAPSGERCNGVDDDCNGSTDEGNPGGGAACSTGQAGVCAGGTLRCSAGALSCERTTAPSAERCNGVDDDCNGSPDDGNPGGGATCSTGQAGVCAAGTLRCTSGTLSCARTTEPSAERCNGLDDDCNGSPDDGNPGGGATCSTGQAGVCAAGTLRCASGSLSCTRTTAPSVERCNGLDDDCNGSPDDGNPGGGAACITGQVGVCAAGTLRCSSGAVSCARTTAPSPERCNGLDDDCNGSSDETFSGLGAGCTAGLGDCARSGTTTCNAAGTGTSCNAVVGAPTAAACDGRDNDCDGIVDEPVLRATQDVSPDVYPDVEVKPYYYSASSCAGGVNGTGTDALAGGALVMGGPSGLTLRPLDASGALTGVNSQVSPLAYTDVDFAQAGDGFVVAGVWENNAEIDLYYVDPTGAPRAHRYTNFKYPVGCSGAACNTLDSLRVVRGNGRRVVVMWREANYGINLTALEPCPVIGGWQFRAPGCLTTTLTLYKIASPALPGLGADSAQTDWLPTQTCAPSSAQRDLGVAYQMNQASISFFRINEDATAKTAETIAYAVLSPRTVGEPEVAYFKDAANADQYALAYVIKDPGPTTPQADLAFWLTNDQSWHWVYSQNATVNGSESIARPRLSVSATRLQLTASRYVADATGFAQQVMTRQTDLAGNRLPPGSAVELSATSGACGTDLACRPGNKSGLTNWLPFGRVYYSGSGATPAGAFASQLTCN